jgi:hypothetical protein
MLQPSPMEKSMKKFFVSAMVQFLVFGLLGAPIWTASGLSLFAFALSQSDFTLDTLDELAGLFTSAFPYAVAFACAIALLDFLLARLKVPYRAIASALVAAAAMAWMLADLHSPINVAGVGLLGAFPAALCSWLSVKIAERMPANRLPNGPQPNAASPG